LLVKNVARAELDGAFAIIGAIYEHYSNFSEITIAGNVRDYSLHLTTITFHLFVRSAAGD